jgi:hypothetical protein
MVFLDNSLWLSNQEDGKVVRVNTACETRQIGRSGNEQDRSDAGDGYSFEDDGFSRCARHGDCQSAGVW